MNVIYAYKKKSDNKIVYVGQTGDLDSRHKQHIKYDPYNSNTREYNYPLSRGIRKYGPDEYELVILEANIPNKKLDDREKYWIQFYNTYWEGYNQTPGGKNPSGLKYTDNLLQIAINMLQDENYSYKDIQQATGFSLTHIYNINIGARRYQDNLSYPLRKSNTKGTKGLKFSPEEAKKIHEDLLNTNLDFNVLSEHYHCSRTTISDINAGRIKNYRLQEYNYPLRQHPHSNAKKMYWENKKACIDYPQKGE